jgi:predicted phosphodiesterase
MESVAFTYRRVGSPLLAALDIDELLAAVDAYVPVSVRPTGSHGFVVPIGDMQFGKIDGDGALGTVQRTIQAIDSAAQRLEQYRKIYDIGHVHIAWLGDHIEGFVSQNGANTWRTRLTLNEQIRLTRRVMLHALLTFAPLAQKVTMVAVPGNHGESVRFEGTGITRYDDSHDTESLIAVHDVIQLMPEKFGHVKCFVPDTDELIVTTEVAETVIAHHHGHKWRPGKEWEWWSDQAFNSNSPMHMADVLLAGHLHHDEFVVNGLRTYWGQPALESESAWFRHIKGVGGAPSSNVGVVKGGRVIVRDTVFL